MNFNDIHESSSPVVQSSNPVQDTPTAMGAPTGGVKLCPMVALAVRVLCLSLALCVAVSSGASGPSVNHVPTHGPDYRLGLSGELISYDPVTVTV